MASKFRGSTDAGQGKFRPDLPNSARMNALIELLNVGPMTDEALDGIHRDMRDIFPAVVDESTQQYRAGPQPDPSFVGPTQRVDEGKWNVALGGGIDPARSVSKTYKSGGAFGYTGEGEMEARTAGNVGLAQERFTPELMQRMYPDYAGLDPSQEKPYLSPDREIYLLEEFARLKGVTTLEIERSPRLTEEFARFLGQKTMTMEKNRYYGYTSEGESYRGPHQGRVATLYRTPTQISNYNRKMYPDAVGNPDFEITNRARGNREQVITQLVDYGMLREHAEEKYDEAIKLNPEESVIANNMHHIAAASTSKKAKESFEFFENGLYGVANKVHDSLMGTMRTGPMGPQAIERFALKIEQGNPNFNRAQARDFLYSFIASYAMVKEANPNAGRAYADFMVLAVLQHAKTKVSKYERKRNQDDAPEHLRSETTEEAALRGERELMIGMADDRKIGKLILDAMGFERASATEQALAGSMAKNIMVDAFSREEGDPNSDSFEMWDNKLFQRETITQTNPDGSVFLDDDNQTREHMMFTLTDIGLDIAERLTPMIEHVMPKAVKKVRYKRRPVVPTAEQIKEEGRVSRSGGPRKLANKKVDVGDVTEMDEMKNVAENTGVNVNMPMGDILVEMLQDFQNLLSRHNNQTDTIEFANDYQNSLLYLIEHSSYQNMKGDGTGNKGFYGDRPGYVLKRDRHGNFLKVNENGVDEIVEEADAEQLMDFSDRIKDGQFDSAIQFIQENVINGVSKEFFYDYFYGLNTRLNVDQNVGNYQHSKLMRALIESSKKFAYKLDNPIHVISLKAGIMKRFGYDKMDILTAADQFDKEIGSWESSTTADKIKIGQKWEGWASVASMAEAVKFNQALKDPNAPVYSTGFYTEIDGLTNGMAHSASQAGDMRTGWGAGLFDPITYDHWVRNYDLIEEFQREGKLEDLAALERLEGNGGFDFSIYLDAYNRVNDNMKDNIRRLWDGSKKGQSGVSPVNIGLPGLITKSAHNGAEAIMQLAHAGGDGRGQGSLKFMEAIRIMSKVDPQTGKPRNKLGRSFMKKPVMIFGYGAGAARIRDAVRNFVDDLFLRDPDLREEFRANGIDIDKEFIDPLGVIAAEAVNQSFGIIKEFATTLSEAASVAQAQGFPLVIPTLAGYKINLGGIHHKADETQRLRYKYNPGQAALKEDDYRVRTDPEYMTRTEGGKQLFEGISQIMKSDWNPFYMDGAFLKAATQITVMLNHANDNINMNRHLVNVHKRKLADRDINYNASNTDAGNTALHIFDGLLVQPYEAEMHTKELNKVFGDMAKANKGHTSFVIDSLTYQLHSNGDRMDDNKTDLGTRTGQDIVKIGAVEFETKYKRLLNEEGQLVLANNPSWGTWHPGLDKYAFQWKGDSAKVLEKLDIFDTRRQKMANSITNYHQFFWATQNVDAIINNNPDRVSPHIKAKKKI